MQISNEFAHFSEHSLYLQKVLLAQETLLKNQKAERVIFRCYPVSQTLDMALLEHLPFGDFLHLTP